MANQVAVQSTRSRLAARPVFRLIPAILGEIGMKFLLIALWFRRVVEIFAWFCILAAAPCRLKGRSTRSIGQIYEHQLVREVFPIIFSAAGAGA